MSYDSRWAGPLSIRHDAIMGIQVLAFDGALGAATADRAGESVHDALDRAAPLVLDLRLVSSVDSAGVALLRSALRDLTATGVPVVLVKPVGRAVTSALEHVGPEAGVPVERDMSEAIKAVAPAPRPDAPRWTPEPAVPVRSRRERARSAVSRP